MVKTVVPDVYLGFPLTGDLFLDATVFLCGFEEETHINSPRATGTEGVIVRFARQQAEQDKIAFGFEIDTATTETTPAAIHFQPRRRTDLVRPFCEVAGEPKRAEIHLNQNARMTA